MPTDVQVDAMGDHARYILPRRKIGPLRWIGLAPIVMGCVMIAVSSNAAREIKDLWSSDRGERIFAYVSTVFLLLFVIPILCMMLFGLIVIMGRTEIRLINGKLSAREHAGPFFWTRRRKLKAPITRVSVGYGDGTATINGKPTDKFKTIATTAGLGVECGSEKKDRFLLTIGYPKEMLLPIGQDLAERLHIDFRAGLMRSGEWAFADEHVESSS
jgi:hypothetical protein